MVAIEVKRKGEPLTFDVVLREDNSETRHHVTVADAMLAKIRGDRALSPEDVIKACFRFLLAREPKESILSRFDVSVIPRYFPEFDREIGRY